MTTMDAMGADAPSRQLRRRPFGFDYDSFELLSLDAATALGPVQLGVEAAYMFHRTSRRRRHARSGGPSELLGQAEHSDPAHAGLRAEYTQGAWVVVLEGAIERAMQLPGAGHRYAFMADGRWLLSSVGFVSFTPGDIGLTLELGGALLNGPTYAFTPRAEQRLFSDFFVEAGAYFLGGKHYLPATRVRTLGGIVRQHRSGLRRPALAAVSSSHDAPARLDPPSRRAAARCRRHADLLRCRRGRERARGRRHRRRSGVARRGATPGEASLSRAAWRAAAATSTAGRC